MVSESNFAHFWMSKIFLDEQDKNCLAHPKMLFISQGAANVIYNTSVLHRLSSKLDSETTNRICLTIEELVN